MKTRNTTRVQIEMPPKSMNMLIKLKEYLEASSYSEVVRSAISAFYNEKYRQLSEPHGESTDVKDQR